jgi:2,3-bisphosphoglycerate-dependent phosphoglycerate mutase
VTKTLYIVRHCKAAGQQPEAALTADGHLQAVRLAERLNALPIERVISSRSAAWPRDLTLRQRSNGQDRRSSTSTPPANPVAREPSIAPLAERLGLQINIDTRLAERVLAEHQRLRTRLWAILLGLRCS